MTSPATRIDDAKMITPISFQTLPAEDGAADSAASASSTSVGAKRKSIQSTCSSIDSTISSSSSNKSTAEAATTSGSGRSKKDANPNFSLRPSYPAVTFDRVCFSVPKSQQQANFFSKCLCQAKQCLPFGDANKSGGGGDTIDILKSINLNVPTGSIFGLLGPSSCGKTTLLRCLVGLLRPSSGSISLFCQETRNFDLTPNTTEKSEGGCCCFCREGNKNLSKVPGANVGYMPQDLGLYEDFTIRQLLTMFGNYMGMESELIKTRVSFMTEFLDLPPPGRVINSLSGGQKRRVSFAIACLHMPPLIILDEPTVGVDPLLRQSIWKYLRRLADEENKTIIITTHYIEEAAQADQVALMRAGEILIQDTPKKIMQSNGCKTLEEAFLKICNKVEQQPATTATQVAPASKLRPQNKFDWNDKIKCELNKIMEENRNRVTAESQQQQQQQDRESDSSVTDSIVRRLQEKAQEKLAIFEYLQHTKHDAAGKENERPALKCSPAELERRSSPVSMEPLDAGAAKLSSIKCLRRSKLVINRESSSCDDSTTSTTYEPYATKDQQLSPTYLRNNNNNKLSEPSAGERWRVFVRLLWALLYKNYRRNLNSIPLLAFQFMLPVIQMITFSLCIGGRPTQIGLGLVNHDQLISYETSEPVGGLLLNSSLSDEFANDTDLLSTRYLTFLDRSMLRVKEYDNLGDALHDVRRGKLWAAMEIGANFTRGITNRFDFENFYQMDAATVQQSVIKLYPDRTNKVLDMICHRSLVNSFRAFLMDEFEHFKRLPIEMKEPVFDIKPNLISNSMDGYAESIAAGLLASLTYIMAAGLTCFIMVLERSAGILERTYTSGISPVAYLLAHAVFRSFVMMLQIGLVLFLTFYLLQQPLVGSIWLAYLMLMTLNITGISYGLLISSLVSDQNGAALTIVSSLVFKITMSGILWPFEAIPHWLRTICYFQPLTMPVAALKAITLKGRDIEDRTVYLGFVVSLTWLIVFLTIAAKRFKFYQH